MHYTHFVDTPSIENKYPGKFQKTLNAISAWFDKGMLSITNFIWPRVTGIIAGEISKGIAGNIFSEDEINSISAKKWKGKYVGHTVLSLQNKDGQENEASKIDWWVVIGTIQIDKQSFASVQSFDLSDNMNKPREMYELLTILKLINIHGYIVLHESSPIQIRERMLWLLKAHGVKWKFDKNQWNETGVYIFTR